MVEKVPDRIIFPIILLMVGRFGGMNIHGDGWAVLSRTRESRNGCGEKRKIFGVGGLDSSLIAPEADMEAVGEAEPELLAECGDARCGLFEFGGDAPLRHQDDAVGRDGKVLAEG